MTDTNTSTTLNNLQQSMRAQLFAIDSQSHVLTALCSDEDQVLIQGSVEKLRDLVAGVEELAGELGSLTLSQKARRARAEKRLAQEVCQMALALGSRRCSATDTPADGELHVITLEQKANLQLAEKKLGQDVCRLRLGKPDKEATALDDGEDLRTMLITYQANQGVLNIALDTGTALEDCLCQSSQEARHRQTFAMQIRTICRMALDYLHVAGC